jgi:AraC-like DNA-binding protein
MSQLRKPPFRVLALVRRYDERSAAACDGIRDHVREHDLEWEVQVVSQAESARIERERRPWAPMERLVADGVIALMCGKLVPEFRLPEKTRSAARVQVVGGTVHAAGREGSEAPSCRQASPPLLKIGTDDEAIGRMAAQHALRCGYRQGVVIGSSTSWRHPRLPAFIKACRDVGLKAFDIMQDLAASGWRKGAPVLQFFEQQIEWLKAQTEPTLIFFHQDMAASWWRDACLSQGFGIPDPIGILGVDNQQDCCETTAPTLSSIALPDRHIGRLAATALQRLMADPCGMVEAHDGIRPLRVIARQSTARAMATTPLVNRALKLMKRGKGAPLEIPVVAGKLGVSRATLHRAFVRDLGMSPKRMQLRLRLERALDLVLQGDKTLEAVAAICGFASLPHFVCSFREYHGTPPGELRRMRG